MWSFYGLWLSVLTFDGGEVWVIKLRNIENEQVRGGSGSRFKWVMNVQKITVKEEEKKEDGEKGSYINMPSNYPKYLKSH
jgi:hypothetical protein